MDYFFCLYNSIMKCGGIIIKKLILLFYLLVSNLDNHDNFIYVNKEINIFGNIPEIVKVIKEEEKVKTETVLATYHGPITAYGPDCVGCSGITSSGQNVRKNIYYNDKEYGKIRIVAADKSLPFGTIIRISELDVFSEPVLAIVLDRGSAIGFNRRVYFDLLYPSEKDTNFFGKRTATFEVLRRGY